MLAAEASGEEPRPGDLARAGLSGRAAHARIHGEETKEAAETWLEKKLNALHYGDVMPREERVTVHELFARRGQLSHAPHPLDCQQALLDSGTGAAVTAIRSEQPHFSHTTGKRPRDRGARRR